DETGERLTPTYAIKKGTRYRYYVSTSFLTGAGRNRSSGRRIPAGNLEGLVIKRLRTVLADPGAILDTVDNESHSGSEQIWLERGFVCHGLGRAQSGTAKLHDALRHGVDVRVDFGPERIQHLMHGDELDSFEIPMGLLCRECQIDGLGEAAVQNINGNSLRVRLEIIPCLMRFHAHFSSASLWLIKSWQSPISIGTASLTIGWLTQ